jgi:TolB protein
MVGIDWKNAALPGTLPASFARARGVTPTPLWAAQSATVTDAPPGRHSLTELKDVTAPHASLLDSITPAFTNLRQRVSNEIGWDYLSSLENAFVPYSDPLSPENTDDWLFTGRSFAANPVPMNAGWMVVMREDFGAETYWRVFLKTRYQDGSQGQPIAQATWNLNDRYNGDPLIYDQGGTYADSAPTGYWLDFTTLAQAYGWDRLPSQINWRTYYPAVRFNQFVMQGSLDWRSAMLQVYPPEFLITTTPVVPPSPTATSTPPWIRPRTATPTATFTATSTRRPTWTPASP